MKGMTDKVGILHRDQSDPALQKTSNNFFVSGPLHGAIISQIFSFTETTKPYKIQLVPNIWITSFQQPVQISIGFLAAVASFQLVLKYK